MISNPLDLAVLLAKVAVLLPAVIVVAASLGLVRLIEDIDGWARGGGE